MTRERRAAERYSTSLRVRYGDGSRVCSGSVENLSRTGLYVRTDDTFRAGTRLDLAIEFPDRSVQLAGEVMWVIKMARGEGGSTVHGMGVQFIAPGADWETHFAQWKQKRVR